ncbi:ABC transporter permease [Marilutibacter aestuarii]|uniref:ABC-2 type transporter transmembrane domain-containing protein n=1 Tax=Marilutibacter aestuarii TaxID=1706195 RepID=A0A508AR95_9GAMM|nr:ABC transporter permease [Lysobacter aestuarii]TQD51004.1 hypothetical protein FKV25_02680 [Lysobacter aestuarii]
MTATASRSSRVMGRGGQGAFWSELAASWRNPEFWALSSWLEILAKARKSRFGILWLLAPSIVYVYGLGSFFGGMQGRSLSEFAAHIALGAMVFRTVISAVINSANVFSSNFSFIMDGHVRLTDYLMQSLAKAFFDLCMYLPVTILALCMFPDVHLVGLLLAPLALIVIFINGLWMGTVFALVGARYTDLGQLVGNVSIFLFLLTPIIWYPDQLPASSERGQLMRFNPFFHLVTLFRAPVLGEPMSTASIIYVAVMTILGLFLATFLYRRYARFVPLWI